MHSQPDAAELKRLFNHRPFSVFAVNRQVKRPGDVVTYTTIHSAFIFPIKGRARLTLGDASFSGQRGTVLHGCPHRELAFEALDGEEFEHVNIYYEQGVSTEGETGINWMERPFSFETSRFEELLMRVEALETLGFNPSLHNRLNQIIGATSLVKSMFDPSPKQKTEGCVHRVRAYLETHYADQMRLADLAEMCGMSEQHLSNRFYRAFGMRPMSFLIAKRLERANELLRTDLLVKDIASAAGYEDPLYFSRLFKKHYGCSPQAARVKP